jgi:hypothetical protein
MHLHVLFKSRASSVKIHSLQVVYVDVWKCAQKSFVLCLAVFSFHFNFSQHNATESYNLDDNQMVLHSEQKHLTDCFQSYRLGFTLNKYFCITQVLQPLKTVSYQSTVTASSSVDLAAVAPD